MLEVILPNAVAVAEMLWDPPELVLLPGEEVAVAGAAARRRAEFTTGRACARRALAQLGLAATPVVVGHHREPIWPAGVVGSLTHCHGYRSAAVAQVGDVLGIGIDAEPCAPLPDGVLDVVASLEEQAALQTMASEVPMDRVLFSAKEAVYKAWFPLMHRWLDYRDAVVNLLDDDQGSTEETLRTGTFTARLTEAPLFVAGRPQFVLGGRWLATPNFVATSVVVGGDRAGSSCSSWSLSQR